MSYGGLGQILFEEGHPTMEEPLPAWADARIPKGEYMHVKAALPTKDGRRCGNGVILEIFEKKWKYYPKSMIVALVSTDAGNKLTLTEGELKELFHPPEYRMKHFLPAHIHPPREDSF